MRRTSSFGGMIRGQSFFEVDYSKPLVQRPIFWIFVFVYGLLVAVFGALSASTLVGTEAWALPEIVADGVSCGYLGENCKLNTTKTPTPGPTEYPTSLQTTKVPTIQPTRSPNEEFFCDRDSSCAQVAGKPFCKCVDADCIRRDCVASPDCFQEGVQHNECSLGDSCTPVGLADASDVILCQNKETLYIKTGLKGVCRQGLCDESPTPSPTLSPSKTPTQAPSRSPTTPDPTSSPTTSAPTRAPSDIFCTLDSDCSDVDGLPNCLCEDASCTRRRCKAIDCYSFLITHNECHYDDNGSCTSIANNLQKVCDNKDGIFNGPNGKCTDGLCQ